MNMLNWKRLGLALLAVFLTCVALLVMIGGEKITSLRSALFIGYKAVPIVTFVVVLFATHGWRLPIFRGWLVPFPDLNGTWDGTIETTWVGPTTNERIAPIPATLRIRQSFLHVSCVMQTGEMISRSFLAGFWIEPDNQVRKIGYSYHSTPLISLQHRSQPHDGTAVFDIVGDPPRELRGMYWSTRKTTGSISLSFTSREMIESAPTARHPMST
jgi:hypothetical protein